jgi:hypothetical protein
MCIENVKSQHSFAPRFATTDARQIPLRFRSYFRLFRHPQYFFFTTVEHGTGSM